MSLLLLYYGYDTDGPSLDGNTVKGYDEYIPVIDEQPDELIELMSFLITSGILE